MYNTGLVPSIFYEVIDGRDAEGFKSVLWQAAIVILSVVIVSEDLISKNPRSIVLFVCLRVVNLIQFD